VTSGLLDTSVLISPPEAELLPEHALVSVISVAELEYGALLARTVAERAARLERLAEIRRLEPLPVDDDVAHAYALIVAAEREAKRNPRVHDTLIAATARAHGLALYTRDETQSRLAGPLGVLLPPHA